jgi:pyruvate,water dikinase
MRASVADLMPEPLSPLFETLGLPALASQMQPLGKLITGSEPVLPKDYLTTINNYVYMNAYFPPRSWWWILTGLIPAYPKMLRKLVLQWREKLLPDYRVFVESKADLIATKLTADDLWCEVQALMDAAAYYICGLMFATMGASAGSEGLLTRTYDKLAKKDGDPEATVLLMGWDNIPVRSEKSLYDMARWIAEDETLSEYILTTSSRDLAVQLKKSGCAPVPLFPEFASRFLIHMANFGHVVFQLDFAELLPLDHPEMFLETIKMYLRGEGVNPHERQKVSEEKRIQTTETMLKRLKGFKLWAFRIALNWGQSMAAAREDALAEIGLAYPKMRELLRDLGRRFVVAGALHKEDDIFWLEKEEISNCIAKLDRNQELADLRQLVENRRAFNEKIKQISPPPMIPMKKRVMGIKIDTFIAATEEAQAGNVLKGVPTSAGKVTAPARVLRSSEDFDEMRPGDVLVAGTTTPAWTPLFAMACAVVTDIGGPLSHGSIVAREYGIPAVMGTGIATKRIRSGQMVTVDGNAGTVILEAPKG